MYLDRYEPLWWACGANVYYHIMCTSLATGLFLISCMRARLLCWFWACLSG